LHSLHEREIEMRVVIERSLGAAEHYATIRSRGTLLQTAEQLGIRTPRTQNIGSEAELQSWPQEAPCVLKLDGTWGGSGVMIVQSRSEAIAAFRRLATPPSAGLMLKRWLVNRDLLAWWSLQGRDEPAVSIQQYIAGRPANTMMACWNGQMLALVTVEVLAAQGATGAATVVRIVDNPEIEQAARLLAFHLQLTGFHGLDFVLEEETGAAYLIELNPRSTQLGHLRIAGQGDLAGMVAERLGAKTESEGRSDCGVGDAVAFFPQTFIWNPQSPYLRTAYHDVPWEEPKLVRDLMKIWWPDRQLLSRLYHYFRPPRRPMEAKFDDVTTTALTR
jgi:predicted ATP-grasp superfamily ATP-dependent carboligase